MKAFYVPAVELPEVWQEIRPLVAIFVKDSSLRYGESDVFWALAKGFWDLWVVEDEGKITSILLGYVVQYPKCKAYEPIAVMGTDMRGWLKFYPDFEAWVKRERNCSMIRPTAQLGWERVLRRFGYGKTHVVLIKEL